MSEWTETELIKIGNIVSGGTPSTAVASFWDGEISFVTPFDLSRCKSAYFENTDRKITKEGLNSSSANLIPAGSIVISSRAPIGYIAIGKKEFTTNQGCKSLVPSSEFDSLFLYYCLNFYVDRIKRLGAGSTFAEISKNNLESIKLPHPKKKTEQIQIARILSTADDVIEKSQATIAKFKAIKQGMLNDLFTRGIDKKTGKLRPKYEDAPDLYKESKLGMVPKEWESSIIGNICFMKSGDAITSETIRNLDNYPVYGGNGLRGFTNNFTHEGEFILIGRQGALCGNINRVSGKFYASEHAVVVTIGQNADVDWLAQKLNDMNLNQYSEASAQPGLSVAKILKLPIILPQLTEQSRIAERLLTIDRKKHNEEDFLKKLLKIKSGLMSDLLSGKKKVTIK